jgi:hypothetical protein
MLAIVGLMVSVAILCPQRGHAQNEIFTVFQCIPGSCEDPVGPTFQGISTVVVHAACTTGVTMDHSSTAEIGTKFPCSSLYSADTDAKALRQELVDDCEIPFFLDTLQMNGSITDFFGTIKVFGTVEFSCDGGEGTPTVFGETPCG